MDLKCMTPNYNRIYAPYLTNPGVLLDLVQYKTSDILLDLAGGTGAISKEAVSRSQGTRNPTKYPDTLQFVRPKP